MASNGEAGSVAGAATEGTLDPIIPTEAGESPLCSHDLSSWKWTATEGFRELVKNWRDAIIREFQLTENEFRPIREERTHGQTQEIVFKVPKPDTDPPVYLGYIHYQGHNGQGIVEITNREARLELSDLVDTDATKPGCDKQAIPPRGLRIAMCVLQQSPQNHHVRAMAGSVDWKFYLRQNGEPSIRYSKLSPLEVVTETEKNFQGIVEGTLKPFAPCPSRDVQFLIGREIVGLYQHGQQAACRPVPVDEFVRWCRCALFLQDVPTSNIFNSPAGDLIYSIPSIHGNLYLKGFLLRETSATRHASISGNVLGYVYNFRDAKIIRETQTFESAAEEGRAIMRLWESLTSSNPHLFKSLHSLLVSKERKYAGTDLDGKLWPPNLVLRLKEYLFQGSDKWYYSSRQKKQNPRLEEVINGLGRSGVEIPDTYWWLLHHFGHVRTAEAEQDLRFQKATAFPIPSERYAQQVSRILKALVRGCPPTQNFKIEFVNAGLLMPSTMQAEGCFKIHKRWLSQRESSEHFGLPLYHSAMDIMSHSVRRIFSDILEQTPSSQFGDQKSVAQQKMQEIVLADQKLLDYIRAMNQMTLSAQGTQKGQLRLHFGASSWDRQTHMSIQVHQESTCAHLKQQSPASEFPATLPCFRNDSQAQGCIKFEFNISSEDLIIWNLVPGTKYFCVVLNAKNPHSFPLVSNTYSAFSGSVTLSQRLEMNRDHLIDQVQRRMTYTLGEPAQLSLAPHKWHRASNGHGDEAIIGIPTQEPETESRKRPRLDTGAPSQDGRVSAENGCK